MSWLILLQASPRRPALACRDGRRLEVVTAVVDFKVALRALDDFAARFRCQNTVISASTTSTLHFEPLKMEFKLCCSCALKLLIKYPRTCQKSFNFNVLLASSEVRKNRGSIDLCRLVLHYYNKVRFFIDSSFWWCHIDCSTM